MRGFFAIAVLLLSAGLAGRADAACGSAAPPDISVTAATPDATVSHALSSDEIPKVMRKHNPHGSHSAIRQVGATAFTLNLERRLAVATLPGRSDCFRLSGLEISLEIVKLDVYVARELKPGSCPYRVTMAHEQRHVAIYRGGVGELRTELEAVLRRSALLGPIPAKDINQAMSRYVTAVDTVVADARRKKNEAMARANGLLDTPASYRAEHAKCPAREW